MESDVRIIRKGGRIIIEQPEYLDASMEVLKEKIELANPKAMKDLQIKRVLTGRAYLREIAKKVYEIS